MEEDSTATEANQTLKVSVEVSQIESEPSDLDEAVSSSWKDPLPPPVISDFSSSELRRETLKRWEILIKEKIAAEVGRGTRLYAKMMITHDHGSWIDFFQFTTDFARRNDLGLFVKTSSRGNLPASSFGDRPHWGEIRLSTADVVVLLVAWWEKKH